jgi:hypothetical protein
MEKFVIYSTINNELCELSIAKKTTSVVQFHVYKGGTWLAVISRSNDNFELCSYSSQIQNQDIKNVIDRIRISAGNVAH